MAVKGGKVDPPTHRVKVAKGTAGPAAGHE